MVRDGADRYSASSHLFSWAHQETKLPHNTSAMRQYRLVPYILLQQIILNFHETNKKNRIREKFKLNKEPTGNHRTDNIVS